MILILSFIFYILSFISPVNAQEMQSENFIIQGGDFTVTSGEKASANYKLSDTLGPTAARIFTSKGYIIQAGFLNRAAGEMILFSVTPPTVDFGDLGANIPVEKDIQITIRNGDTPGYSIRVVEDKPLSTSLDSEIIDTACDMPDNPCTAAQASEWIKNTSYGFGYRMQGKNTPSDFTNKMFFRPFPAVIRNEPPVLIMQSKAKKAKDSATMTVKVVIDRNQPVGLYRNILSFTAIAGI